MLNGSKKKTSCGTPSIGSRICSALGRSWCSAPVQGAIISFAQCLHPGQPRAHMPTIWACNGPCSPFLVSFLGAPHNNRWHGSWRHYRCAWDAHGGLGSPIRVQTEGPSFLGILGRCITHACSRSGYPNWQHRSSVTWRQNQEVVWETHKRHRTCLIAAGSWVVHLGRSCVSGSQVSGRTVGSISRLPLLNTTSGRLLYLLNRAPLTRPTCAHILELDARTSCADAPQDRSSHCNRLFSAPSCWRA